MMPRRDATTRRDFRIRGMDCAEEIRALKREVGACVSGEEKLAFDLLQGKMTVAVPADIASDAEILHAIRRAGLRGEPWAADRAGGKAGFWQRHGREILTAASGSLLLAAIASHAILARDLWHPLTAEGIGLPEGVPLVTIAFYLVSTATGIALVLPKAAHAIRGGRPDMNLLMTIAVIGAIILNEWFEAASVAFLFSLALLLESWSVGRARRAIHALLETAPPIARIRRDGETIEVEPAAVEAGTIFVVRPGETFPLDGQIVSGHSDVDQAPITGESVPVAKRPGDEVYAGTTNGDGLVEVRCDRTADQTRLANIARLVMQAQSRRAPSEQWVERFARVYTPAVLSLAVAVFLLPPLLGLGSVGDWFYRGLVLLVIACPCALVISTPVSIVAALTRAAHRGVLVKGGRFMEAPARLHTIAFDKTGTLTEGLPRVTRVVPLAGHREDDVLALAAALEADSNHPLARAISDEAAARDVVYLPAESHHAVPGKGVTGRVAGRDVWLGSHRYAQQRGQSTAELQQRWRSLSDAGHGVVVVGTDAGLMGLIALADRTRPGARQMIESLHRLGIARTVMLTGDHAATASAIAEELGIDRWHADLLPEDKVALIEELSRQDGQVAMVGDGVNDAPALAASGLGIAMAAVGSDVAIETADIALMSDDLSKLPWLVRHARRTLRIIRQNIALALAIKLIFVALTFFGWATLWAAIAADMGASLIVIFNGLRLLREGDRTST